MVHLAPWNVAESNFPHESELEQQLTFLLKYAILAPSSHNSQPWKFSVESNDLAIFPDFSRSLPVVDPYHRELFISLGCALENLLVAADHFGFKTAVDYLPEGEEAGPAARVSCKPGKEPFSRSLFHSIPRRHTNRLRYGPISIEKELLDQLIDCRRENDLMLEIVVGQELKSQVGELIIQADQKQFSNKGFREELAEWLRPNIGKVVDGLPGYTQGVSTLPSLFSSMFVRGLNIAKGQMNKDRKLVDNSPALTVIFSKENDTESWLKVGQFYERLALLATNIGIVQAPMNQPVEIPELADELADLLGRKGRPQMLFRMGHAKPAQPIPRRPLEEVLI
ncbi:MAG: hypothetical protein GF308_07360 [Candidatus Heimdallarchaeota archaeon]|nr:hypothetical protein [Candidatus Heimdallarchaeota archaeon]